MYHTQCVSLVFTVMNDYDARTIRSVFGTEYLVPGARYCYIIRVRVHDFFYTRYLVLSYVT